MKVTLLFITFISFCSFTLSYPDVSPGNTKWIQAGKSLVNTKLNNVSIIPRTQDPDFIALRLAFEGEPLNVHHYIIHFDDGKSKRHLLKKECASGFKTKIVEFNGESRIVKKVDVWYQPNPRIKSTSTIYLWVKG